jgi:RNA polymerase sigma-70 factor (ECF subfamily)
MPEQIVDEGPGPVEAAEGSERAAIVRDALRDVAPRYREVLFLVYIEGMLVADVARHLGLPQGTVKSRLKRGRDALRRILVRRSPEQFGGIDALS